MGTTSTALLVLRHALAVVAVLALTNAQLRRTRPHGGDGGRAGGTSPSPTPGPPLAIGGPAPAFGLRDVHGIHVAADDLLDGGDTVLVFLRAGDPSSAALAKELGDRRLTAADDPGPAVVAIAAGAADAVAERLDLRGFRRVLVDEVHVVSTRYGVHGAPAAVAVGAGGRLGSALVEGPAAVTDLLRVTTAERAGVREPALASA